MTAQPGITTSSSPPNTVVQVQPGMEVQPVVLVDKDGQYVTTDGTVLTTLGDTLYENATPAPARLPGNTTATKKYFTQTGTGAVSAAPDWETIAAGDVPQLASYAPTGLTGATAASRYAGATTGGAPASGTFAVGDYVIDQASGSHWVCVTAGSPGTWVEIASTDADYLFGQNLASGETVIPRLNAGTGAALVSQKVVFSYWTAVRTETCNTIIGVTAGTAAAATPTYCAMGIYSVAANGDLALLAQCANDTTLFASTFTTYSRALTSTLSKVRGVRYAFAYLVVSGSAMPAMNGYNGSVVMPSVAPLLAGSITGQSVLPSTVGHASVVSSSNMNFGAVTP